MADPGSLGGRAAERGTVYLVGGGPGDPALVTQRATALLATATFVAYDRLAPHEPLALCRADAELLYVGKQPDRHALSQDEINAVLVDRALAGHAVVRWKGGDPFVFGRGSEEALHCRDAGVPFEVVPGVTSAIAAPAYAGIPVTHRGLAPAFAVVTGHEAPSKDEAKVDYQALARFPGTLLLLMGVGRIGEIADALVAAGRSPATPVTLVRWGTTPHQEQLSSTLAEVGQAVVAAGFGPPAVTVVGEVAALADELAWFHDRPLHGRRVLVPRTRHQASSLSARLRALGAAPVEAPTIALQPTRDPDGLAEALERMAGGAFTWTAFTSANGVDAAFGALASRGWDARAFARTRVAAVGPGTGAALQRHGILADLVPTTSTTAGLADALLAQPPGPVLLPRADLATPHLARALADAGWEVTEIEAYRTVPADGLPEGVAEDLRAGRIDAVALASSSTARNLVDLLGGLPHPSVRVASIGPVTSATCRELGLEVHAEASPSDLDGLVQAVLTALS